jgi:putative flippase GtrA
MSNFISVQFIQFGVVGFGGMTLDFFVTWICKEKLILDKYLSNTLGFCIAVSNNFILNRYWTFNKMAQNIGLQFSKFAMVSIGGLIISNLLLFFLIKHMKANFYVTKFAVICLVFVWNYSINLLFTFK